MEEKRQDKGSWVCVCDDERGVFEICDDGN